MSRSLHPAVIEAVQRQVPFRLIEKLTRVQLLILDDFETHSLTDQQRFHLFEIGDERYQKRRAILITA
ncbi:hypothetical protein [Mesorhizobium sp. M0510]|uniref:hypothetical protein n=1 Tax=Mesorhizobium sp. M0510 TaxID=2956954 RepID=UPI00333A8BAE